MLAAGGGLAFSSLVVVGCEVGALASFGASLQAEANNPQPTRTVIINAARGSGRKRRPANETMPPLPPGPRPTISLMNLRGLGPSGNKLRVTVVQDSSQRRNPGLPGTAFLPMLGASKIRISP